MMHALLINWLAFSCFAFLVCWSRYRLEKLSREVDEAHAMQSLLGHTGGRDERESLSFCGVCSDVIIHIAYLGQLFGATRA